MPIEVAEPLQLLLGCERDRGAADGDHLVHAVVADHVPHRRFRHVAEGLGHVPDVEEIGLGIPDPELHDPLHDRDVQVAGQHQRLCLGLGRLGELGPHAGPRGAEAELHLELALDRHFGDALDPERQLEVGSRVRGANVGPEPLDDAHLLGLDLVVGREEEEEGDESNEDDPDGGERKARDSWRAKAPPADFDDGAFAPG
jgi:hypothetical protein